jgi:uncharacterized protein YjaG (DUF416 family)
MNDLSDFSSFVLSLASSAFYYMGESPDSNSKEINLEVAKHSINTISMLEEKTKGNLSMEEIKLLEDVLYKLRTKFIKLKKMKNDN